MAHFTFSHGSMSFSPGSVVTWLSRCSASNRSMKLLLVSILFLIFANRSLLSSIRRSQRIFLTWLLFSAISLASECLPFVLMTLLRSLTSS